MTSCNGVVGNDPLKCWFPVTTLVCHNTEDHDYVKLKY